MKRLFVILPLFVILLTYSSPAQQIPAYQVRSGGTLPAVCNPLTGDVFALTSGNTGLYSCTAVNIWTRIDSSGVFNVKSFGAVADGLTNDQPAIAAAIAAAGAQGGVIYFPRGWYALGATITINARNNLHLVGESRTESGLVVTGTFPAIAITGVCAYLSVEKLLFLSTAARAGSGAVHVTGTAGVHSDHITLSGLTAQSLDLPFIYDYVDQFLIRDIFVLQAVALSVTRPLRVQRSISGVITNVMATSTAGQMIAEGFLLDTESDSIQISDAEFLNAGASGVRLANTLGGATGPRLIRLDNVYSETSTGRGFEISAGRDIRLQGCHAAVNGDQGFEVSGGDSITFQSCLSLQNQLHGFYFTGGTAISVLDSTASNNSQIAVNTRSGIYIDVNNVRVIGNRLGNAIFAPADQMYGIVIAAARGGSIIVANDLNGNTTGTFLNAGLTTNLIALNQPDNTIQLGNVLFAALGLPANGTIVYCSNCTIASPCAAGGTGAIAKRLNGIWVCN